MQKSRFLSTAIVALIGAIVGSFSMMLFASTHFSNVAGPGNTPPALSAAPLVSGGSDQDRIVSAVKRVQPSVVALNVTINGQQVVPNDPFSQLFGGGPGIGQMRPFHERASGSGFVYSRTGLIVTNAHVVAPQNGTVSHVEVVFANGDKVPGHVFAANIGADLALVKVDGYAKLPPPLEIADSDKLSAGQWAIAIGEPLQLKQTVTVGVVSGFNRTEPIPSERGGVNVFKGLLQTSAPINPGNSGGPLIDMEGRLIGVNQSTANPQYAAGIGFAIPSNTVRTQVAILEKTPGTRQGTNSGFIGASLQEVNDNVRAQLNYRGSGVVVAQVVQNSPADAAGLQPGDVIQKINGRDVSKVNELIAQIRATKPGQTLNLQVWNGGVKRLANVKVAERPADYNQEVPQEQP